MIFIRKLFLWTLLLSGFSLSASALDIEGSLVQGGFAYGKVAPGSTVWLDNKPIYVGEEGDFVLGFGRDHPAQSRLSISSPTTNSMETHTLDIADRDFDIERVNGLPPKTVSPPPEWAARRKLETGRVAKGRAAVSTDTFWKTGFIKPAKGRFSGFYGSQRILNGKPRSPHYGLDIAGPIGTPIYAPAGGKVTLAAPDFLLEGGIVIIDHGYGVSSTLFHMDTVTVSEGQIIEQGDPIGTIGEKGRASGPHVDWRLNWRSVRLDPALVIGLEGATSGTS
ncbi:peptidase [Kordiimonas sediminis]|uniref:Peptidase n=1 Tax=Kordiimonas sediminis TaxID=1735581 RepID=A0A919AQX5_9PROT|nr:M23 family metallopeptidase [Kordiimonas sediminis]GHF20967.1 peptidase [Kordiimonas sediminis]